MSKRHRDLAMSATQKEKKVRTERTLLQLAFRFAIIINSIGYHVTAVVKFPDSL